MAWLGEVSNHLAIGPGPDMPSAKPSFQVNGHFGAPMAEGARQIDSGKVGSDVGDTASRGFHATAPM